MKLTITDWLFLPVFGILSLFVLIDTANAQQNLCTAQFSGWLKSLQPEPVPTVQEPYMHTWTHQNRSVQPSRILNDAFVLGGSFLSIDGNGDLHGSFTCTENKQNFCDVIKAAGLDPAIIAANTTDYPVWLTDWLTANPCP